MKTAEVIQIPLRRNVVRPGNSRRTAHLDLYTASGVKGETLPGLIRLMSRRARDRQQLARSLQPRFDDVAVRR